MPGLGSPTVREEGGRPRSGGRCVVLHAALEEKDQLLARLGREGDPARRRALLEQIQSLFYEDVGRVKLGDVFWTPGWRWTRWAGTAGFAHRPAARAPWRVASPRQSSFPAPWPGQLGPRGPVLGGRERLPFDDPAIDIRVEATEGRIGPARMHHPLDDAGGRQVAQVGRPRKPSRPPTVDEGPEEGVVGPKPTTREDAGRLPAEAVEDRPPHSVPPRLRRRPSGSRVTRVTAGRMPSWASSVTTSRTTGISCTWW